MWWISRAVLYLFWLVSIVALCGSRIVGRSETSLPDVKKADLKELELELNRKKEKLNPGIKPVISIVIVNTNDKSKLTQCLDSLSRAASKAVKEITVVDNNSSDGTVEYLKKEHPRVKIVRNGKNLGYPRAVNNGVRASAGDFCLILNPDIIVIPGAIEVMLEYALSHPKVGIVGCKLLNTDGTLQYSVRRFIDLRTYLYRFTPLRGLMAGSALERFYLMQDWDHNNDRAADWVLGGCMLVRRITFEKVGLMDEKIFLYFDDVDWCFRMWESGWQVAYVAGAVMIHKHIRASANRIFSRATREHFKSLFYFIKKHGLKLPKNCPSGDE